MKIILKKRIKCINLKKKKFNKFLIFYIIIKIEIMIKINY